MVVPHTLNSAVQSICDFNLLALMDAMQLHAPSDNEPFSWPRHFWKPFFSFHEQLLQKQPRKFWRSSTTNQFEVDAEQSSSEEEMVDGDAQYFNNPPIPGPSASTLSAVPYSSENVAPNFYQERSGSDEHVVKKPKKIFTCIGCQSSFAEQTSLSEHQLLDCNILRLSIPPHFSVGQSFLRPHFDENLSSEGGIVDSNSVEDNAYHVPSAEKIFTFARAIVAQRKTPNDTTMPSLF